MNTLGHLLAFKVTPTNKRNRAQVAVLPKAMLKGSDRNAQIALVDQGYMGANPAQAADDY